MAVTSDGVEDWGKSTKKASGKRNKNKEGYAKRGRSKIKQKPAAKKHQYDSIGTSKVPPGRKYLQFGIL